MLPSRTCSVLVSLTLFMGHFMASGAELRRESPLTPSSLCARTISKIGSNYITIFIDPLILLRTIRSKKKYKQAFLSSLEQAKSSMNQDVISKEEMTKVDLGSEVPILVAEARRKSAKWAPRHLHFAPYGSDVYEKPSWGTIDNLYAHIRAKLPKSLVPVAMESLQAMQNFEKILKWAVAIRTSVREQLWDMGVRESAFLDDPNLTRIILDLSLAQKVADKGFIIDEGAPHDLKIFNGLNFMRVLSEGKFFIDWTGEDLSIQGDGREYKHYVRGHAISVAYLAEHVPAFIDLYKYIGQSNDKFGLWGYLFDNTYNPESPFWGGFWIEELRYILMIHE